MNFKIFKTDRYYYGTWWTLRFSDAISIAIAGLDEEEEKEEESTP